MTRRATKIKELRSQYSAVLVLDAGNSLDGDRPFSQGSQGATTIEAMNLLGYDAMALGLKDLDLGADVIRARMEQANFPLLAANIRLAGGNALLVQDYVVRNMGGHRIAIIGLSEGGSVAGFTIEEPAAALQRLMPEVRSRADIVVVVTHASPTTARVLASTVTDIDLIVTGGDEHLALGEEIGGALIVHADVASPGHAGRNMGVVALTLDSQGIMTDQTNTIAVLSETIEEDPDMLQWLQGIQVAVPPTPANQFNQ